MEFFPAPTCGLPYDVLLSLRPFLPSEAFNNVDSATAYENAAWDDMVRDVASLEQASHKHTHTHKGGAYKGAYSGLTEETTGGLTGSPPL